MIVIIKLLAKLFIKDCDNPSSSTVRSAYGILCGAVGIFLNIVLFALKITAGTLSGSIAITADAFNNLSDAGSSFITLIGFRLAGQKADSGHPFGHGRVEYITGLIVSFVIIIMGFELAKSSFDKILYPEAVEFSIVVVFILCASIAVKLYMSFYNRAISKKIGSEAMMATAADSISDTLATFVVLISMIIMNFTKVNIDGYSGLLVSAFIFFVGIKSARDTISPLLGQPPSPELVEQIRNIVLSHQPILGIHDLIVHNYGPGRFMISLHAEINAKSDMLQAHDLIDNIERDLSDALSCNAVIHMDPVITDDDELNEIREMVQNIVSEIDPRVTMHDFRMVTGPTHTNLIFDIVIPFNLNKSDILIKNEIAERIRSHNNKFFVVIDVDKSLH